jgi:hypothetical protein
MMFSPRSMRGATAGAVGCAHGLPGASRGLRAKRELHLVHGGNAFFLMNVCERFVSVQEPRQIGGHW